MGDVCPSTIDPSTIPTPCSVKSKPYDPTPPCHSSSTSVGSNTCTDAKAVMSTSVNVAIVRQSHGTRMT